MPAKAADPRKPSRKVDDYREPLLTKESIQHLSDEYNRVNGNSPAPPDGPEGQKALRAFVRRYGKAIIDYAKEIPLKGP